jgi:hypothetical protein
MAAPRATPPDLDELNLDELKALIVSQHELIVSRDGEIEQLKLLSRAREVLRARNFWQMCWSRKYGGYFSLDR